MKNNKILSLLMLLGYIIMLTANGLANAIPLNNKTTGELSDAYPNLFVPAGLTFSIWGIIYLWLLIFVIYAIVVAFRQNHEAEFIKKSAGLFILNSLSNAAWIFCWHYEMVGLSIVMMLIIFSTLLLMYQRLGIGFLQSTKKEKYLVNMPISLYTGWITVATIANITALLVSIDWQRFGLSEEVWAIVMISIAIVITLLVLVRRKDYVFSFVIIWALIGIYIKRSLDEPAYMGIIITTLGGILLILSTQVYSFLKKTA